MSLVNLDNMLCTRSLSVDDCLRNTRLSSTGNIASQTSPTLNEAAHTAASKEMASVRADKIRKEDGRTVWLMNSIQTVR